MGVQVGERGSQFGDRLLCPEKGARWTSREEVKRTPKKIADGYLQRLQRDIGEAKTRLIKAK